MIVLAKGHPILNTIFSRRTIIDPTTLGYEGLPFHELSRLRERLDSENRGFRSVFRHSGPETLDVGGVL